MDATIRAKFYQVENVKSGDATLYDALHRLWAHPNRPTYKDVFGGIRVRIERFESEPSITGEGFVDGEFVRQQTENIPPVAEQGAPLEGQDRPLGHRCAFRYHAATNVLLLESRPNGVTPIRMDGLVRVRLSPHKGFFLSPVLTEAALYRLRNGTPRRVTFRVARPADMASVEGDMRDIQENLTRFTNNFHGLSVEVSVGFPKGNRDGILSPRAITRAVPWATENRSHVEKFEVKISEEDDPIDVFAEQLKIVKTLNLENMNVDAKYEARRSLLRTAFNDYLPVIQRTYVDDG